MLAKEWLKRTGSLNFISISTCLNITYIMQKLCEANASLIEHYNEILKHLFQYLLSTADLGIRLGGKYYIIDLNLRVYSNAAFADDLAK